MPVAFNAPPFPTADAALATAADSAVDASSIPADAFAQLLLAAGRDPELSAGKDPGAALPRGRHFDAHGGVVADKTVVATRSPRDPPLPTEPGKRDATSAAASPAGGEVALDPAAAAAALSAVMTAGLKSEPPGPRAAATAPAQASIAAGMPLPGGERGAAAAATRSALFNAVADAPAVRPGAMLPGAAARSDALTAASSAPAPTAAERAGAMLAAAAVPKELLGDATAKLKDASDAGTSNAALQSMAMGHPLTTTAPPIVHSIDTPVTAPGWESEFAGKLTQVVMLRNDRAEFHLHPAELGPVDVQISFASDQAVVLITAADATTRSALEQALPYLRDMLADQGIALGQASVQGERNPADPGASRGEAALPVTALPGSPDATVHTIALRGLVDVFA